VHNKNCVSMASEVMKLTFAILDVSFNSGHYTRIIKRQLCTLVNDFDVGIYTVFQN